MFSQVITVLSAGCIYILVMSREQSRKSAFRLKAKRELSRFSHEDFPALRIFSDNDREEWNKPEHTHPDLESNDCQAQWQATCSAPNIYICASSHVSLFLILTSIRYDHSVISSCRQLISRLQIVNNILKSDNIIITGSPFSLRFSSTLLELTSTDTQAAVAPGEAYVN